LALTAAKCGPRMTQETLWPASASRTAKWLPTAPAPKMHIRMVWLSRSKRPRLKFPQSTGLAQPIAS